MFNKAVSAVKQQVLWFCRAWPFITVVLVLAVPLAFEFLTQRDNLVRLGAALQVLGVCIVVWGVDSKLRKIRDVGVIGIIISWIKDNPAWRKPSSFTINATLPQIGGNIFGELHIDISNYSSDQKIAHLITEVEQLKNLIIDTRSYYDAEMSDIKANIENINHSIDDKISAIKILVKVLITDDFKLELLGAMVLVIGIIFASIPDDVIKAYLLWRN